MSTATPENIIRHELIGLHLEVVRSLNKDLIGQSGIVIDETKNMLVVSQGCKRKLIPKSVATFHFTLQDGTKVEVDGRKNVGRPEDRLRKRVRKWQR
jgi:ribonuclease P protein subunit POP4